MIKRLLLILGGLLLTGVLTIVCLAATKPDTFKIERSTTIKAAPEQIFAILEDFHQWGWSPWEKLDPNMQRSYGGASKGKGSLYRWEGNNDVGTGCLEIKDTIPPTKVQMRLDIIKPFEAKNDVEFNLTPALDGTEVTWSMKGQNNFISKIMQIFINTDAMCGKQFEEGLSNLKKSIETPKKPEGEAAPGK